MKLLLTALVFTVADASLSEGHHQRKGVHDLKAELQQLRTELSQAPVDSLPITSGSPSAGVQDAEAFVAALPPAREAAAEKSEEERLDNQVGEVLDKEQALTEQLQASQAQAALLSGELRNKTRLVKKAAANLAVTEEAARSLEMEARSSAERISHDDEQLSKLQQHDRWLGGVSKKMLKADKELQGRTDSLQKEIGSLKTHNSALLASNKDLKKGFAIDGAKLSVVEKKEGQLKRSLKKMEAEKQKLQKSYDLEAANQKTAIEGIQQEAVAKATTRTKLVVDLRKRLADHQQQDDVLREKMEAAEGRGRDAKDRVADSTAALKQTQSEIDKLQQLLKTEKETTETLQQEKSDLQDKQEKSNAAVEDAQETLRNSKGAKCTSLQKKVDDAEGKKAQMNRALEDTVRLGKQLAKENAALKEGLKVAQEKLRSMMKRDGEASHDMSRQIEKLHNQLQEVDDESTMAQPDTDGDDVIAKISGPASLSQDQAVVEQSFPPPPADASLEDLGGDDQQQDNAAIDDSGSVETDATVPVDSASADA